MQKIRNNKALGNNFRSLRMNAGLTQEEVAARLQLSGCNISRNYYSRYETGELNVPVAVIVALTKIFNCSYDELFFHI